MKIKHNLALAALVYTLVTIMWHNSQVQAIQKDTIELNNIYIDQTIMDIKPAPKEPIKIDVGNTKIYNLDLVKLTRSVAHAETGNGTRGHGAAINNICGIMHWPNGVRKPVVYKTYMDGFNACYSLIKRKYQDYTIKGMASLWTGNDNAHTWANNVEYWYNKQS